MKATEKDGNEKEKVNRVMVCEGHGGPELVSLWSRRYRNLISSDLSSVRLEVRLYVTDDGHDVTFVIYASKQLHYTIVI